MIGENKNWPLMRLSDCCVSIADGDHQPPPKADNGVPFVTIANIVSNKFDFSDTMYVPMAYYEALDPKRKAMAGDILYSVVGSFGIPVFIDDNMPFVFQRHIAILRPSPEIILPKFLYYTMLSRKFYQMADAAAVGAAQRTVSLTALRNMRISLPNIDIQQKIVDTLAPYDDLIATNQKQIALLEEAAQRIYKEWFINFHFPGFESASYEDGIPVGWAYQLLPDVFDFVRGKSYSSDELDESRGTLMVNLKNIRPFGGYKRNEEKRFTGEFKPSQTLAPGDVIMGVTDMTQERRLVGHVAMVPDTKEPMTFSMDIIKLIPRSVTRNFLYSTFYYGGFSKQISPLANGVNVLHLKPEAMMSLQMLVPSEDIINKFDTVFEPYRLRIEALQNQCNMAEEARDRLLPRLMDGTYNE